MVKINQIQHITKQGIIKKNPQREMFSASDLANSSQREWVQNYYQS